MSAEVLRGRPIVARVDARRASAADRAMLGCNWNPRISLAFVLDAVALRRAQAAPGIVGRLPAPRAEVGCGPVPPLKGDVSGVWPSFARGASPLPPTTPGGP